MCEPTSATLAIASLAASAVGTAASIYGQVQAGKAAQGQANYQAAVARNNAIIAERNAADAEKRGEIAETRQRQQVAQLAGRQRATLAGNGVVIDEGSALDITTDTAGFGELDALTVRNNADREAYRARVEGANFQADAGLYDARGSAAASAGMMNGFSSLLSGAGSVADKWYGFKKEGVFP